jgi:hypothetical protein
MSAWYFTWKKKAFSNKPGNHLCQIKIDGPSRLWVISELYSPLQETGSPFLYGINLDCLVTIHTCESRLNFLNLEAVRGQKQRIARCPSRTLLRLRLPKMTCYIMVCRTHRYPRILSCWMTYCVRNIDLTSLSLHFQQARNSTRGHEHIGPWEVVGFWIKISSWSCNGISLFSVSIPASLLSKWISPLLDNSNCQHRVIHAGRSAFEKRASIRLNTFEWLAMTFPPTGSCAFRRSI